MAYINNNLKKTKKDRKKALQKGSLPDDPVFRSLFHNLASGCINRSEQTRHLSSLENGLPLLQVYLLPSLSHPVADKGWQVPDCTNNYQVRSLLPLPKQPVPAAPA